MKSWASACWARSRSAAAQVGAAEQVLVHAHRALVLAAAAEQVAEREVQLGGVRVLLHRLDEGVDRLVVLLVEQEVQALVSRPWAPVGSRCALAQVEARAEPAEREGERQAPQQPLQVKVHRAADAAGPTRAGGGAGAASTSVSPARRMRLRGDAAMPPPARHHREDAERAAEAERGQHDEHHRRAPVVAEEPVHASRRAGCSARRRTG